MGKYQYLISLENKTLADEPELFLDRIMNKAKQNSDSKNYLISRDEITNSDIAKTERLKPSGFKLEHSKVVQNIRNMKSFKRNNEEKDNINLHKMHISKSIQNLHDRRFGNRRDSSSLYSSVVEADEYNSVNGNKQHEVSILQELVKSKNKNKHKRKTNINSILRDGPELIDKDVNLSLKIHIPGLEKLIPKLVHSFQSIITEEERMFRQQFQKLNMYKELNLLMIDDIISKYCGELTNMSAYK